MNSQGIDGLKNLKSAKTNRLLMTEAAHSAVPLYNFQRGARISVKNFCFLASPSNAQDRPFSPLRRNTSIASHVVCPSASVENFVPGLKWVQSASVKQKDFAPTHLFFPINTLVNCIPELCDSPLLRQTEDANLSTYSTLVSCRTTATGDYYPPRIRLPLPQLLHSFYDPEKADYTART